MTGDGPITARLAGKNGPQRKQRASHLQGVLKPAGSCLPWTAYAASRRWTWTGDPTTQCCPSSLIRLRDRARPSLSSTGASRPEKGGAVLFAPASTVPFLFSSFPLPFSASAYLFFSSSLSSPTIFPPFFCSLTAHLYIPVYCTNNHAITMDRIKEVS